MKNLIIHALMLLPIITCPQVLSAGVGAKSEMGESIKELVARAFPEGKVFIGGTTHHSRIEEASGKIIANEFGYLTPANAFKQTYIHPEPDVYDYDSPDDFIVYGKASNMLMRLHAPISPQCSSWAKEDSRTAEELASNLEEYLIALYKRYAGIENVRWLDVVNETIVAETGKWMMPKKGTATWENPWPRIGFDDSHPLRPPLYIRQAFKIANQHASNQQLIINQHGQLEPKGWETMKALVGYLRDNGLRVDGVGWQAHVYLGWEKEHENVRRLGEIIRWCHENNLEFHITEFNVFLRGEDKGKFEQQADTFAAITKTVLDNRTGGVVGINFWHMADPEPQKKLQGCLFDGNHNPKPAYFRIKQLLKRYAGDP